jgi:hypothetical protein
MTRGDGDGDWLTERWEQSQSGTPRFMRKPGGPSPVTSGVPGERMSTGRVLWII